MIQNYYEVSYNKAMNFYEFSWIDFLNRAYGDELEQPLEITILRFSLKQRHFSKMTSTNYQNVSSSSPNDPRYCPRNISTTL